MQITIENYYEYEPEACDCCSGYYDQYFKLIIDGREVADRFTSLCEAEAEIIKYLDIKVDYLMQNYPDD